MDDLQGNFSQTPPEPPQDSGPKRLIIREIIGESWHAVRGFKKTYWGGLFFAFCVFIAIMIGLFVLSFAAGLIQALFGGDSLAGLLAMTFFSVFFLLFANFFALPVSAGLYMLSVRRMGKGEARASMVFNYYHITPMWRFFGLNLIYMALGMLITLVPSVIASVVLSSILSVIAWIIFIYIGMIWVLGLLLVADKQATIGEAISLATVAVVKHFWKVLLFIICMWGIMLLTVLTLMIGLIWFLPLLNNMQATLYRELFGISTP